MANDAVILALQFQPTADDNPRPEQIASTLEDIEGLYRVTPVATALGLPVADLLTDYRLARAEAAAYDESAFHLDEYEERLARALKRFDRRPSYPSYELEDAIYLLSRLDRERLLRRHRPRLLLEPEHAMRLQRIHMESPLELLSRIPAEYWTAGGFFLFLRALEARFNMVERIRTERVDLRARRAERRADEREADVREERAARELEGLRDPSTSLQLVSGEVRPDDPPKGANRT